MSELTLSSSPADCSASSISFSKGFPEFVAGSSSSKGFLDGAAGFSMTGLT